MVLALGIALTSKNYLLLVGWFRVALGVMSLREVKKVVGGNGIPNLSVQNWSHFVFTVIMVEFLREANKLNTEYK